MRDQNKNRMRRAFWQNLNQHKIGGGPLACLFPCLLNFCNVASRDGERTIVKTLKRMHSSHTNTHRPTPACKPALCWLQSRLISPWITLHMQGGKRPKNRFNLNNHNKATNGLGPVLVVLGLQFHGLQPQRPRVVPYVGKGLPADDSGWRAPRAFKPNARVITNQPTNATRVGRLGGIDPTMRNPMESIRLDSMDCVEAIGRSVTRINLSHKQYHSQYIPCCEFLAHKSWCVSNPHKKNRSTLREH